MNAILSDRLFHRDGPQNGQRDFIIDGCDPAPILSGDPTYAVLRTELRGKVFQIGLIDMVVELGVKQHQQEQNLAKVCKSLQQHLPGVGGHLPGIGGQLNTTVSMHAAQRREPPGSLL